MRESAAWQRYGPVRYRIRKVGVAVFNLAGAYLCLLLATTLVSFYQGVGAIGAQGPTERPVRATVQECHRVGPLSYRGLGYWWVCDIAVQADGRPGTQGVLTRSIATPDQIGQTLDLLERCYGEGNTDCGYGRHTNVWWDIYLVVVRFVRWGAVSLLIVNAVFHAVLAFAGAPRYARFVERRAQRKKRGRHGTAGPQ